MNINKIVTNTNFGVRLTDKAKMQLQANGATDFEISTLLCKMPVDATIDIDKYTGQAFIRGQYATIHLVSPKLTMEKIQKLCEEYNIKKYFSIDSPSTHKYF